MFLSLTIISFQELNHIRAVAVFMTFIMVVSILASIAIIRRILMATSVLKASTAAAYKIQQVVKFFLAHSSSGIFTE